MLSLVSIHLKGKELVRLEGFEPPTCCSGGKFKVAILLARFAFCSVMLCGFMGYSGGVVPQMFPTHRGEPVQ